MRQCCSRARARSDLIASGALSVAPQAGRALFSCSAHDINAFPTGPGVKSTSAVRCRAIIYWATAAIYGEALDSHFRPYLLQGRTSEGKKDCNKKSPPLDKTTSSLCLRRATPRPDIRLRTRFGTPASPSIEHRSTAAAAPRLGRSSKLTPLACSECIAATATDGPRDALCGVLPVLAAVVQQRNFGLIVGYGWLVAAARRLTAGGSRAHDLCRGATP